MEITKEAEFVTDFYGGRPYLSGMEVVQNWLESQGDKLLHPRMAEVKSALGNETKLEEILSVFNTNGNNEPVIGNWMLLECSMDAAKLAGTWTQFQVSFDTWKTSVQFTPIHTQLYRDKKLVAEPDFVEPYQVTTKRTKNKGNSFFKAYQAIKSGAKFGFTMTFPDDICTKIAGRGKDKEILPDPEKSRACAEAVMDKMCIIGLGAYRLRFGKFKYV